MHMDGSLGYWNSSNSLPCLSCMWLCVLRVSSFSQLFTFPLVPVVFVFRNVAYVTQRHRLSSRSRWKPIWTSLLSRVWWTQKLPLDEVFHWKHLFYCSHMTLNDTEFNSVPMDYRGRRHPNQVESWTSEFIVHRRKYRHTLQQGVVFDKTLLT